MDFTPPGTLEVDGSPSWDSQNRWIYLLGLSKAMDLPPGILAIDGTHPPGTLEIDGSPSETVTIASPRTPCADSCALLARQRCPKGRRERTLTDARARRVGSRHAPGCCKTCDARGTRRTRPPRWSLRDRMPLGQHVSLSEKYLYIILSFCTMLSTTSTWPYLFACSANQLGRGPAPAGQF